MSRRPRRNHTDRAKPKYSLLKSVAVPLRPPQIPHWTRASAVRGRRITSWVIAQSLVWMYGLWWLPSTVQRRENHATRSPSCTHSADPALCGPNGAGHYVILSVTTVTFVLDLGISFETSERNGLHSVSGRDTQPEAGVSGMSHHSRRRNSTPGT
jgi:hypothetical protein